MDYKKKLLGREEVAPLVEGPEEDVSPAEGAEEVAPLKEGNKPTKSHTSNLTSSHDMN